ncbi:MAG: RdgB/HAM1 family non-canonical purine NTP pyrophosphatase [Candidatus Marinimicrobia bacterium]|nr:RdgB/HAM1 family non-canonical purine NTP pyrophosphatase [Candidatus Neomarinimicrobiota bacterium]
MKKKLVLATRNRDKIKEIKNKLGNDIIILTIDDFDNMPEVIEDGETLEENAIKKARIIFEHTKLPAIADDTGLFVDALNGRPGVFSSRFAGEDATYDENVDKLIGELKSVSWEQRNAKFITVIAYMDDKSMWTVEGRAEGKIIKDKKGNSGFGYDPVFYYEELGKTFSEMDIEEKNKISHRAIALRKFVEKYKK